MNLSWGSYTFIFKPGNKSVFDSSIKPNILIVYEPKYQFVCHEITVTLFKDKKTNSAHTHWNYKSEVSISQWKDHVNIAGTFMIF